LEKTKECKKEREGKKKGGKRRRKYAYLETATHLKQRKNTQREPFPPVSQFVLESARGISIIKKSKNHSAWVTIITKMNRGDVSIFPTLSAFIPHPPIPLKQIKKGNKRTNLMNHQKGGQPHELPPTKGGRSEWSVWLCSQ
jgi:hypothetical protein